MTPQGTTDPEANRPDCMIPGCPRKHDRVGGHIIEADRLDMTKVAAYLDTEEAFVSAWRAAFYEVEQSLIADGFTCDQLAPDGRPCIACTTSERLRTGVLATLRSKEVPGR